MRFTGPEPASGGASTHHRCQVTEATNSSQPSERQPIAVGLITALWVPYALLAARYWFLCDDAFISFRYAKHLARGRGLTFNAGSEPVEGFSNLLWVLLAAIPEAALVDPAVVMPALSAACGAVLIWRVVAVASEDFGVGPMAALAAGAGLASAPAMGVWASSGLETMAFALLFFLAFEALVLRRGRAAQVGGALAIAGLVAVRAEGPAWALVVLFLAGLARSRDRGETPAEIAAAIGPAAIVACIGIAALEGFRLWMFGDWLPNTVRAKVSFSVPLVLRGAKYVALYGLTFPVQVLALLAAPFAIRRRLGGGSALVALALGVPIWAVVVGGDFFPMGRLLLAALPFGAVVAACALQALIDGPGREVAAGVAVVGIAIGVLPAADVHVVPEGLRAPLHFRLSDREFLSEHARWANLVRNTEKFALRGRALAEHTRRGETIVARAVGALGYYSELVVYDQYGLTDADVASRPLGPGPLQKSPGHDREVDAIFFADRDPDYLFARYVRGPSAAIAMADSLRRWSVPAALRDRYVPDFLETELPGELERGFLFLVRRARADEDPTAIWEDFETRRRALHRELQPS